MTLRTIPIHRVGNRENLFMGGDRELIMVSGVMAFIWIFHGKSWATTLAGLILWFLTLYIFRLIAKSDPKMRWVYLRHRGYKNYYPARSTPFRINMNSQGRRYK